MPLATNAADVGRGQGKLHLVGVGVKDAVEGFDQAAGLFHRVVVVVVGVFDVDGVDDDVESALLGAGVVEQTRLLDFPRVDALMEDGRDDVHVSVDDDGFVVESGGVD